MKSYRVAILGCRSRGTTVARAYASHPRTEVVGLCDLRQDRLDALGDELGVTARLRDFNAMIRETGPDIVVITTGTEFHYELAMGVLEHGVHLDLEKPICADLEQADDILTLAGRQTVQVAVHHQGRTSPGLTAVANALREGRIGRPRHIVASGKGYYGGYGLMNIGCHLLNATLELAGHCRRVTATALTGGRPIGPDDVLQAAQGMGTIAGEHITAVLEFDGGLTASLLQHRFPKVDSRFQGLEILGDEGRLFWDNRHSWWLGDSCSVPGSTEAEWEPLAAPPPPGYDPAVARVSPAEFAYVESYVRALDEGGSHTSSGGEARHVLEIMMGVFESAAYGRPVHLPQTRRDHPLLRWLRELGLEPPSDLPRPYEEWLAAEDRRLERA